MMEAEIKGKLERIFDIKVSFDEPGESNEQEVLFVEIETARPKIKDGREIARVTGQCAMYGNNDKLKYGYFAKKIELASPVDKNDFFFSEFEQNSRLYRNMVQRSFSFTYFYSGQYDPEQGSITSTEINIEVNS